MSFTQDQLTALEAAIASGTLEVRIGDKLIRYQTTVDMIRARDLLRDQLNAGNPTTRTSLTGFCKD
jgi:hypothetical protein